MEHSDVFYVRENGSGEGGGWDGIDGISIGVNIGANLLEEVLPDEIREVRVTNVLPKTIKVLGVLCG